MHAAEPSRGANLPSPQAVHLAEPLHGENLPEGQPEQAAPDFEGMYEPGGHSERAHAVAPVVAVLLPAAHATQLAESVAGWYFPATQFTQLVDASDSANFPLAHDRQLRAPIEGWYRPEGQLTHGFKPSENSPSVQGDLQFAEPLSENKPEEHPTHIVESVAPGVEE